MNADTSAVITVTPTALTDKNLYAYCDNNPVMRVDYGGYWWCELDIDGYMMSLEGAGGGAGVGLGSAYRNYAVKSRNAAHDAHLGGYYSPGLSSGVTNTSQYYSPIVISVVDSMAVDGNQEPFVFYKSKNADYVSKRNWTQNDISITIRNGVKGTSINRSNGKICDVYQHPGAKNQYIVIERYSRKLVQLSDLKNMLWKVDDIIHWN